MFPFPPKTNCEFHQSEFELQPLVRGAMGPPLPPRAPLWNPAPGLQAANAGGSTSTKRIRYFDAPRQEGGVASVSAPIGGQLEDIEEELVYLERPTVEAHLNHILEKYTKLKNHHQQLHMTARGLAVDNERLCKEKLHFENRAVTEKMARHSAEVNARKEVLDLRNEITNLKADKNELLRKIEDLIKNGGKQQVENELSNYTTANVAVMEFMKRFPPSEDDAILNDILIPSSSLKQQPFSLGNVRDQNQPNTSINCEKLMENIAPGQQKPEKTTTDPFLEAKPSIDDFQYKAIYHYNDNLAFDGLMEPVSGHEDTTSSQERQHLNSPQNEQPISEESLLDLEIASLFVEEELNRGLQVSESAHSD